MATLVGGNIGTISFGDPNNPNLGNHLAYLQPGQIARLGCLFDEIFWTADPAGGNYGNLENMIKKCAEKKVIPLFLLNPAANPGSYWYKDYNDWWFIRKDKWDIAIKCINALCAKIKELNRKYGIKDCFVQIHNEPAKGKPGGSNQTMSNGQWHPDHHELFFRVAMAVSSYFPKSRIIGPAISCLDNFPDDLAEQATCYPPSAFNWLNYCGYRAYHYRMGAGWVNGDINVFKTAILDRWNIFNLLDKSRVWPIGQKIAFTEFYNSVGDCGITNLNPYPDTTAFKQACLALVNTNPNVGLICPWGLLPRNPDPGTMGNIWFEYGGWGPILTALGPQSVTSPVGPTPISGAKTDPPIAVDPPISSNPIDTKPTGV